MFRVGRPTTPVEQLSISNVLSNTIQQVVKLVLVLGPSVLVLVREGYGTGTWNTCILIFCRYTGDC